MDCEICDKECKKYKSEFDNLLELFQDLSDRYRRSQLEIFRLRDKISDLGNSKLTYHI